MGWLPANFRVDTTKPFTEEFVAFDITSSDQALWQGVDSLGIPFN